MGIWNKLKNEFIDIIEWLDSSNDTIAYRFERYQNEIKYGAKLTVREGQIAVFVNEGQIADVYPPGMYALETQNMPILSTLKGWKYGFNSPFKAEVYFINTKQFTDQKWGTKNAITLEDDRFGMYEIRAFGTYAFRVTDGAKFVREILGTDGNFTTEEINGQLRSLVVTRFTDAVGESKFTAEKFAGKTNELSEEVYKIINGEFAEYGITLTKFLIENISMPEEIKKEIFELSRLNKVDISKLAQMKAAKAIEKSAENDGGAGMGMGMGMGVGMGVNMANMMGNMFTQQQQQNQNIQQHNSGTVPPPIPGVIKYFIALNGQQQGPFELSQLQQMVSSGQINRDTLVWKEGMAAWAAAGSLTDLAALFSNTPPPIPPAQ